VAHFERELWSENPVEPPDAVAAADPVFRADDRTYTHAELLAAARDVAAAHDLGDGDVVALDAPLTEVGALAAGVLAGLSVGATVRLGGTDGGDDIVYVVRTGGDNGVLDPSSVTG